MGEISRIKYNSLTLKDEVLSTSVIKDNKVDKLLRYNSYVRDEEYEVESKYFNSKTGGYYVIYKGHDLSDEEKEAAEILADNGFEVVLTPEGSLYPELKAIDKNGKAHGFRDGLINEIWYDQRTPEDNSFRALKEICQHPQDKRATIGVCYDNKGLVGEIGVRRSIGAYRNNYKDHPEDMTVKIILLVDKTNRTIRRFDI